LFFTTDYDYLSNLINNWTGNADFDTHKNFVGVQFPEMNLITLTVMPAAAWLSCRTLHQ